MKECILCGNRVEDMNEVDIGVGIITSNEPAICEQLLTFLKEFKMFLIPVRYEPDPTDLPLHRTLRNLPTLHHRKEPETAIDQLGAETKREGAISVTTTYCEIREDRTEQIQSTNPKDPIPCRRADERGSAWGV